MKSFWNKNRKLLKESKRESKILINYENWNEHLILRLPPNWSLITISFIYPPSYNNNKLSILLKVDVYFIQD